MNSDHLSKEENTAPSEQVLAQYAEHTRKSLIARLENWEDQKTWDEFYRTYWKLIYSVALKSGLREDEAWDVVQETILSIAKQSKKNMYDPTQGSFKLWLWNITKWRINDQYRKRKKDTAMMHGNTSEFDHENPIDKIADESSQSFDQIWESEWQHNLLYAALERVKAKVSPRQYQIFDYYVLKEWDAGKVRQHLGVSIAQVYLAKHRVGSVLKKEMEFLRAQERPSKK